MLQVQGGHRHCTITANSMFVSYQIFITLVFALALLVQHSQGTDYTQVNRMFGWVPYDSNNSYRRNSSVDLDRTLVCRSKCKNANEVVAKTWDHVG